MQRSALPTATESCGVTPTASCPPVDPVEYEATAVGQFNSPDLVGFPLPTLIVGFLPGDSSPPVSGTSNLYVSVPTAPVSTPPTPDDVPGPLAWQLVASGNVGDPGTTVGLALPLQYAPPQFQGQAVWVRQEVTTGDGCVQNFYLFFPEGIPAVSTVDVEAYFIVGNDVDHFTVPAAADDETPGDPVTHGIEWTPECPPPAKYLPIGPNACGLPIPVDAEVTFPDTPIQVTGPGGGPVQVVGPEGGPLTTTTENRPIQTRIANVEGESVNFCGFRSCAVTVLEGPVTISCSGSVSDVPAGFSTEWSVDFPGDYVDNCVTIDASAPGARAIVTSTVWDD